MITTLFFIQLIAFQLCYVTSSQVKIVARPVYLPVILRHKQTFRMLALVFMLIATIVFVVLWGWMTGLCASLVGLMGIGCLVVSLNPFRYLSEKTVFALYGFFLLLELLV